MFHLPLEVSCNPNETFGEAIKRGRKEKGLSLRSLARKINISHPYLSQLENGRTTNPSLQIIFKLATVLDMSLTYLMHLSGIAIEGYKVTIPDELLPAFRSTNYSVLKYNSAFGSFEEYKVSQMQNGVKFDSEEKLNSYKNFYEQLLKINEIEKDLRNMANLALKISDHDNEYKEFTYKIDGTHKHTLTFEVPAYKTEKIGDNDFTSYIPPEKALESFFDIENLLNLNPEHLNFRGKKLTNNEKERLIQSLELITMLSNSNTSKNKE